MKEEVIIIRADKDIKKMLNDMAQESRRSASDYLRLLIEYAKKKQIKL